jgi:hypothetical protein
MNELFPSTSKEAHFFGSSPVFSLLLFSYAISLRIPWVAQTPTGRFALLEALGCAF